MELDNILKINPLLLELGAGTRPRMKREDGWLFNDVQALPGIDLVAPCSNLGLPKNSVSKLFLSHLAEHQPWDLIPKIFSYWYSLLCIMGSLELISPNCEYAMKKFIQYSEESKIPPAMLYRCIWGTRCDNTEELPPHNQHYTGFTKNFIRIILQNAGFVDISVKDYPRFGIKDRDIYAIAYKK